MKPTLEIIVGVAGIGIAVAIAATSWPEAAKNVLGAVRNDPRADYLIAVSMAASFVNAFSFGVFGGYNIIYGVKRLAGYKK